MMTSLGVRRNRNTSVIFGGYVGGPKLERDNTTTQG